MVISKRHSPHVTAEMAAKIKGIIYDSAEGRRLSFRHPPDRGEARRPA